MKTLRINSLLLSNKPTHLDIANNRKVKIYPTTVGYNFQTGEKMYSADIMTGKSKGLLTQVYEKNLIKL